MMKVCGEIFHQFMGMYARISKEWKDFKNRIRKSAQGGPRMGKVNDALNDYMEDAEVFADFCNGVLYGGKKVITPEKLRKACGPFCGD